MKYFLWLFFLFIPILAFAEEVNLEVGSINLPSGYIEHRTGTKDSRMGEIANQDTHLVIHYDIGVMSGTHMHPKLKRDCVWYQEQTINGCKVYSGVITQNGKRQLIITINEEKAKGVWGFPANFWAEIGRDEDIAEVMLIALSYLPYPGK